MDLSYTERFRRECLEEAEKRVRARGLRPGELQWKWRTGSSDFGVGDPCSMYQSSDFDYYEAVDAILDALNREGISAWLGDGVLCVADMIAKQAQEKDMWKTKYKTLQEVSIQIIGQIA